MKNEKKLLSLPFPECPKITVSDGKGIRFYTADVVDVDGEECLELTIFDTVHEPWYRVFVSAKMDYVAQRLSKKEFRRSTAKIYSACQMWWEKYIADERTENVISAWAKKNHIKDFTDGIHTVAAFLEEIGQKRADAKFKRIQEAVDRQMLEIRPLPSDFSTWLENVPFKAERYIIYQYSCKKVTDGYCTHCKRHIEVRGARDWQSGICPKCHSHITYLAEGKLNTDKLRTERVVSYIQPTKNDFVIRRFEVERYWKYMWDKHELVYRDYLHECERHFYGGKRHFEVPEGKGYFRERYWNHLPSSEYVYAKKLKKIAMRPEFPQHLKYVPWIKLFDKGMYVFERVWELANKYPIVESYIKRGMYRFVDELSRKTGEGIEDLLNTPKRTLKIIEQYDMKLSEMPIYTACQAKNREYVAEALEFTRCYRGSRYNMERPLKYNSYPILMEYFKAQDIDLVGYWYSNHRISDYDDYLEQCEELGWDMTDTKVIRPRNFKERHEYATQCIRLKKQQIEARGITRSYHEHIFDLYYTDGEYSVILPKDLSDLKYEGDTLRHCVYTNYAEKVARGKSIICFIRKNSEFYKPYVTAELTPETYSCIQIRGYQNNAPEPEVKAFWDKYMKHIKKIKKNLQEAA